MDGWITIGTELSTNKFDKQLSDLERKMKKEEDNAVKLDIEINVKQGQIEKAKKALEKLPEEIDKTANELQQVASQMDALEPDTAEYDRLNQKLMELYVTLEAQKNLQDRLPAEIERQENKVEKLKIKQQQVNEKIDELKRKIDKVDLDKMKKGFDGVGSSLQKAVKKAGKLVLGFLGIRQAISFLTRASSDLAEYDKQYATNLEYIRFVLTQAIAPILRAIVQLAMQLLRYINLIAQAWFGVNLFANGSVEAFNKMKKSASKVGKAVKEIKKQLLGFDEINVLTDQSDTGTSVGTPSMDLSQIQGETPEWLKWILDNGERVAKIFEMIAAAILSLKSGFTLLQGAGVFLIIDGIVDLVKNIEDFSNNPSVQSFGKILQSIGKIILGIGIVAKSVPIAVIGQIVTMVGGIVEYIGNLIEFFKNPTWENYGKTLRSGIKSMGILGLAIDWLIENVLGGWDKVTETLKNVGTWIYDNIIKPVYDKFKPLIDFFANLFKTIWENLKTIISTIWNNIKVFIDNAVQIFNFIKNKIVEFFTPIAEFFGNVFQIAVNKIKEKFSPIIDFFKGIWDKLSGIFQVIGTRIGEIVGGAFRAVVNAILTAIENVLNTPIRAINTLIGVINSIPGLSLGYLNTFNLPRLKTGGIINMPNTGTMIGGAIAGESGKEGVIPLTDTQAMAELGREIGRWITVNANITNTMNGRVISRELKQIQNEQDFAYNT